MARKEGKWLARAALAATMLALGACAARGVSPETAPPPIVFKIEKIGTGPNGGSYQITPDGGNVRVRVHPGQERVLRWESDEEFTLVIRPLPNDEGEGGDDFGSGSARAGSTSKAGARGQTHELRLLDAAKSGKKGTSSGKYTVTMQSGHVIDPVVIVDR